MPRRGRFRRSLARTGLRSASLAAAVPLGLPGLIAFGAMVSKPGKGAWLLAVVAAVTVPLTRLQRDRLLSLLGVRVPPPAAAPPAPGGHRNPLAGLRRESTWRQIAYHLLLAPLFAIAGLGAITAWAGALVAVAAPAWLWAVPSRGHRWPTEAVVACVSGLLALVVLPWLVAGLARLDVRAVRLLLGPNRTVELSRRVETLAESRAGVVDAADAERRRIERDLHDGAQQRLVSLAVNLGLALATMKDLPPDARRVIEEAHREAKEAIEELALLVRGLHPAVLDDRGLDAALSGIAERSPVPVDLAVRLTGRAAPTVEAVAYFTVSEALANIAKHARATRVSVTVEDRRAAGPADGGDRVLRVVVSDDGRGGADPSRGTGLHGLARRAAAVDGTFRLTSPAGGPTIVTVELPCAL